MTDTVPAEMEASATSTTVLGSSPAGAHKVSLEHCAKILQ